MQQKETKQKTPWSFRVKLRASMIGYRTLRPPSILIQYPSTCTRYESATISYQPASSRLTMTQVRIMLCRKVLRAVSGHPN